MQVKDQELNESQMKAVTHVDGPLLVLAGAGCGKTRVVVYRIAHLLKLGIPPSAIVALTFTNKAAGEMKERVEKMTNHHILASTFHALGVRILREKIHLLGYESSFTIYDEKESESLLKSCLETLGMKDEKGLLKSIRAEISDFKNQLCSPEEVKLEGLTKKAYTLYNERLKEYNALDFDDLLFLTAKFCKNFKEAKEFQDRWSYILVDEYQDTNLSQYEISKFLAGSKQNLFVVGDPDQSIYSWRGANIENILNFEKDFPGAKVVTLDQNYRSTTNILSAANGLIEQNERPYEKHLFSNLGEGEKPTIHIHRTDRDEAQFVTEKISHYLSNFEASEIVVFYRTNSQSRIFEDYFLRAGIPYKIVGGFSFYQRKEIKDLLSFLRLTVSGRDFISFERSINIPKRGFGPAAILKVRSLCDETGLPVLEVLHRLATGQIDAKMGPKQRGAVSDYLSIFARLQEMEKKKEPLEEIIREAISRSKYLEYLKEDKETFEERKGNIEELIAKAFEWREEVENPDLFHFLEELSLLGSVEEGQETKISVSLMTLHNGKGLEFPVCFIVGMEEELFPHANAKDSFQGIEEERRLCYVGMTRAKRHLHLSSAGYRFLWGSPKTMHPSRFLSEIPKAYIDWKSRSTPAPSYRKEVEPEEEDLDGYRLESIIFHRDFGKGVVKKRYQTSLGLTYDIYFVQDGKTRSLVAKYARLSTEP
jgi:DNA helicase-2/ATP-dependent DNA helicase PcrA